MLRMLLLPDNKSQNCSANLNSNFIFGNWKRIQQLHKRTKFGFVIFKNKLPLICILDKRMYPRHRYIWYPQLTLMSSTDFNIRSILSKFQNMQSLTMAFIGVMTLQHNIRLLRSFNFDKILFFTIDHHFLGKWNFANFALQLFPDNWRGTVCVSYFGFLLYPEF